MIHRLYLPIMPTVSEQVKQQMELNTDTILTAARSQRKCGRRMASNICCTTCMTKPEVRSECSTAPAIMHLVHLISTFLKRICKVILQRYTIPTVRRSVPIPMMHGAIAQQQGPAELHLLNPKLLHHIILSVTVDITTIRKPDSIISRVGIITRSGEDS